MKKFRTGEEVLVHAQVVFALLNGEVVIRFGRKSEHRLLAVPNSLVRRVPGRCKESKS